MKDNKKKLTDVIEQYRISNDLSSDSIQNLLKMLLEHYWKELDILEDDNPEAASELSGWMTINAKVLSESFTANGLLKLCIDFRDKIITCQKV